MYNICYAITTLRNLYDRRYRHLLTSRKQRSSETLDEFLTSLQLLAQDCAFTDVKADQYAQEAIRDSPDIRQRLLESAKTTVADVVDLARCIEVSQKNSDAYITPSSPISETVVSIKTSLEDNEL